MKGPFGTVLFDVDGTLVDSNYQHAPAWYRAFRRYGHTLPLCRLPRTIGHGGDQDVEYSKPHPDLVAPPELLDVWDATVSMLR